jgi:tetratricopeptide (TPR) repeat protein
VRHPLGCLVLSFLLAAAAYAQGLSARSWEDCLNAPDRACVLDEAIALLYLQDRGERRYAVVASVAETWARAGEIDRATRLAVQVPDWLLGRIAMLREIAAAEARASHREEAEAGFDRALQLAYRWKDPMERAETLYAIVQAQEAVGMKADADITFDQALQAVTKVVIHEKGQPPFRGPIQGLAALLRQLAVHQAEAGEIAQALRVARYIAYNLETRARTLLAIGDLQMRAGVSPEATLDEALAAEGDARSGIPWSNGIRVTMPGNTDLLCDIAKMQARAGLTAKAVATLDEALRSARAIAMPGTFLIKRDTDIAGALMRVADAQREVGLNAAAGETLERAASIVEANFGDGRADALARLAEARTKAGDSAQDSFARALSIARALPNDFQRAQALMRVALAQVGAGLRSEGVRTFTEAVGFARSEDAPILLADIANAQYRAGLMEEAAATFEEALSSTLSSNDKGKTASPVMLIHAIADNGRGTVLVAASPSLHLRLLEAADTITDRVGRAEMLTIIARALPN